MSNEASKYERFAALHVPGDPLILYNIWDAGSAHVVANAGAKAIATGSYGVAEANGMRDGQEVPWELVVDNCRRIVGVTSLPVSVDVEAGYGDAPRELAGTAAMIAHAGAVGINLEDRAPGSTAVLPVKEAAAKISAMARDELWINARTDVFRNQEDLHSFPALIDEVISRAFAYADAGAGSLFVPFLTDHATIAAICERSPLPVNVLRGPMIGSNAELAALGVARISYGHMPWEVAMECLRKEAQAVYWGEMGVN